MTLSKKHVTFNFFARGLNALLGKLPLEHKLKASLELIECLDLTLTIRVRNTDIRFKCDSETVRQRAVHMPTREPETLDWIDTFEPDEVMYYIG